MDFEPDYQNIVDAAQNRVPRRLPLYEHLVSTGVMEKVLGVSFAHLYGGGRPDLDIFFTHYCRFFREMGYDTVSYEGCITEILPNGGALGGGKKVL